MITPNNKFFNQQWGLRLIKAPEAWQRLNNNNILVNTTSPDNVFGASDIIIAVYDNGLETYQGLPVHNAFKGNVNNNSPKFINSIDVTKLVLDGYDRSVFSLKGSLYGTHGQEVAGIISSKAKINGVTNYNGEGIIGVAPNTRLYSLTKMKDVTLTSIDSYLLVISGLGYMIPTISAPISSSFLKYLMSAYGRNFFSSESLSYILEDKLVGTERRNLDFYLNNNFTDIVNISQGIPSNSNLSNEYSLRLNHGEITALGRDGRGVVIVVGSGNGDASGQALDIEPTSNQFINEYASSSKVLIVGATGVDDNYNWLTGNPPANEKITSYSNYGNRVDICAPAGSSDSVNQSKNATFTSTIKGAGQFLENSPLKLTLKSKIDAIEKSPPNPDKYEYVLLEFDNLNGVFANQFCYTGSFSTVNGYKKYFLNLDPIVLSTGQIILEIVGMKKTDYVNLIDSITGTPATATVFEFSPLFSKITQVFPGNKKLLQLESLKGAYIGADIFIGTLGNSSAGRTKKIVAGGIDYSNNQIKLSGNVTPNVGDYVVFPSKKANITNTNINATTNDLESITVDSVDGFFIGSQVRMRDVPPTIEESAVIKEIDTINRKLFFEQSPSGTTLGTLASIFNVGFGDIEESFSGTSAAAPFVSGVAALVLSANRNLNSLEVKHILKETADKIDSTTNPYLMNADGYTQNQFYGAGRLNADAAVQLALNWHNTSATISKPIMKFFDNLAGTIVPNNQLVDSPDIWIKMLSDASSSLPTPSLPFNSFDTSTDQKIYVRVRNIGNRQSFKECDLRVFVAFSNDVNPSFSFPERWHLKLDETTGDNTFMIQSVPIPLIAANSENIIEVEFKDVRKVWDKFNTNNKKAYILAHISPFDGSPNEIGLLNHRSNKNLTCKPVNATHYHITTIINNSNIDIGEEIHNITVNPVAVPEKFSLEISNILESRLNSLIFTFVKKNRASGAIEQTVVYKKTGANWGFHTMPTGAWVEANIIISDSVLSTPNYKNAILEFTLTVDQTVLEVTYDVSI